MTTLRSTPTWRSLPPVLEFLSVLWEVNHRLEMASSEMLRTKGITAQQRMMLRVVGILAPVSAGTLAQTLHVHPGTLSTALKRLERKRLLSRRRDEADARRILITLTPRGEAIVEDMQGTVEEAVHEVLRDASTDHVLRAQALLRRVALALPVRED